MDTFWIVVGPGTPSMPEFVRKMEGYSEPNSARALRAIWDAYLYDPSLWEEGTTSPMLTFARQLTPPPVWEGSPCSPAHPLLAHCSSCDFARLEIFNSSAEVWESAEFPQAGRPRPFWKHGQPHGGPTHPNFPFPQNPEVFTGVCKTLEIWIQWNQKSSCWLQFLDHFCLGLRTNEPHFFLFASWGAGGKVLLTDLCSVGHWPS